MKMIWKPARLYISHSALLCALQVFLTQRRLSDRHLWLCLGRGVSLELTLQYKVDVKIPKMWWHLYFLSTTGSERCHKRCRYQRSNSSRTDKSCIITPQATSSDIKIQETRQAGLLDSNYYSLLSLCVERAGLPSLPQNTHIQYTYTQAMTNIWRYFCLSPCYNQLNCYLHTTKVEACLHMYGGMSEVALQCKHKAKNRTCRLQGRLPRTAEECASTNVIFMYCIDPWSHNIATFFSCVLCHLLVAHWGCCWSSMLLIHPGANGGPSWAFNMTVRPH